MTTDPLRALDRFPRVPLVHAPTPLEPLPRLSAHLGGPRILVKRDDATGLAFGGNKARKLEYLMAEAVTAGADTILTTGAVQSNHARQTAAAAARLGLGCVLVLRQNVQPADPAFYRSGNLLLDRMLGAETLVLEPGSDPVEALAEAERDLRRQGRRPFVLPIGGATPVGCLGYVAAARELVVQARDRDLKIDRIVHATGSGGTQAGLLAGLRALGEAATVTGVTTSMDRAPQEALVEDLWNGVAGLLDLPPARRDDITACDQYYGGVYGEAPPAALEAVGLVARTEGLLLDPIYAGVAMAALIDQVREGRIGRDEAVVFLHTGGGPGLFAYVDALQGLAA